ncbi:GntR family transcriptional regulator [Gulosibacter sediminis]|uniref:GntR family transcriptional regulator n=1 Tax=Gulosibacter sediminis TaxID=1729695 RepID=UPI0024AD09D5|nr:GntR family transcriptional regulator [Gulosibacter sediminis]
MASESMNLASAAHGQTGEHIAQLLRDDILSGEFLPGARLGQVDLAERYGTTRAPIRDALRILAATGLVSHVANAGARVTRLSADECAELYRMRERIEPLLFEYTLPQLTGDQLAELQRLADAMAETEDPERFVQLDREFHDITYAPGSTHLLADTVRNLWDRTQHYRRQYVNNARPHGDRASDHDHQLLVKACAARDVYEAGQIIELHVRRTRLNLAEHPEIFR